LTVRVRQVGRASDPQAEMQLQELTRAVNELGGDVEGVQRTLPDVIEDIEEELDDRIPIPTEPPTIPTNLVAIPSFQMFILKWDRSVSEIVDGYIVSFSTSEDGTSWSEWEEIVLSNISVFTHTGLDPNVHYRYRVLAYNRAGRSLWSNMYVGGKTVGQTANEISSTVSDLETNTSSTFQQHANMINQRVVAKDRYGNVINYAQIQVGLVDSQGYILLDASDVFVPGTMHFFDRNPGSAASGQVTIDSDGVEIRGGKLSVVNPSGTVIIDGTSNMFKIVDTGLLAVRPGYGEYVVTDTILPSAPAFTFYADFGTNTVWDPFFYMLTSTKSTGFLGWVRRRSWDGRIEFRCDGGTENGETYYVRYFLYKEAGI
jgi:hypothetical protein